MKYLIFVLCLISSNVFGDVSCSFKGTKVLYTNGVFTPEDSARHALREIIQLKLNSSIDISPGVVSYDLAYNRNVSLTADFIESAVQRFPDVFINTLTLSNPYAAFKYFAGGEGNLLQKLSPDIYESILSEFRRVQLTFLNEYSHDYQYLETLNMLREEYYEKSLYEGYRVFAISHSQGGLFMEDVYRDMAYVKKDKYFAGFQIASPIMYSGISKKGYATHTKDKVIDFLFETIGTFEPNITAPLIVDNVYYSDIDYLDFVFNHGIVTTYLYDSVIKGRVVEEFKKAADLLESNCPIAVIKNSVSGLKLSLDSTNPNDNDLKGLVYQWNFGDGEAVETTNKDLTHTYLNPGVYTVTLRITNSENREFWPKATLKKQITVGEVKCGGEPGKTHINPDGSIGGYVSNLSTVASTVTLGRLYEVCGNSQILGASKLVNASNAIVRDSVIIDSNFDGNAFSFRVTNSIISNSYFTWAINLNIADSSIANTKLAGIAFDLRVLHSDLLDVDFMAYSGGNYTIEYSTIKRATFRTASAPNLYNVSLADKTLEAIYIHILPTGNQIVGVDGVEWSQAQIASFLGSESGLN
ncbi:PKD domain-containing protein [Peredibacter sp. HCB2-198]|uniref:PKD domain-containing protein n=1 Tax=Peredibacter sp. HCB2-198 TaxID=3383025 RepID=UPI0038B59963